MTVNKLYYGDNLDVLKRNLHSESVDLVYLDPPFNSNRNYNVIFSRNDTSDGSATAQIQAFEDTWVWTQVTEEQYATFLENAPNAAADALSAFRTLLGDNDAMAYLVNMAPRLLELHRVLKDTGTLWLHCDPTMSHYLKVLLDAIFGARQFRNEIVWHYSGWNKKMAQHYERRHDVIFYYSKSDRSSFDAVTVPWASKDEYLKVRKQKLQVDEDGREYVMSDRGGGQRIKRYIEEAMTYGRPIDDTWHIDKLNNSSAEALGYPTQKPLQLLERIIACSPEDAIILDPFCGCGTTVDAAQRLGRRWIGVDITYIAIDLIDKRLRDTYGDEVASGYEILGIPRDLAGAYALFSRSPFDFERWAVSLVHGTPNQRQVGDRGVDGVARFRVDSGDSRRRNEYGRVLISVKGGQSVGPSMVRDLLGAVETQQAEMGLLVTMVTPTRGMVDAVNHAGSYVAPWGQTYPRVQIISVPELLAGRRPTMPGMVTPYIAAARQNVQAQTLPLFDIT